MADSDAKRYSVTRNDVGTVGGASVWNWIVYPETPRTRIPAYWSQARDAILRRMLYEEFHDFWAGAIGIAVAKMSSLAWELESSKPRLRDQFQEILLSIDDNKGWTHFLARHLQDYLGTDNGAFLEIARRGKSPGSPIAGLFHLDSCRCTRTGDPDTPVRYRDTQGVLHDLRWFQVLTFADMPSPSETYYGVGLCATSRAIGAIRKMEAIERYIYEKVSGDRALALDLVGGVLQKDIETAVQSAKEQNEARGNTSYLGAIMIPVPSDVPLTHERINFAELPDGFDYDKQVNNCILVYANAIGLDVQDLQPLTGRPLGTATQSQVLEDKSAGKGLSAWRQQFTHLVNQYVLPDTVTFAFTEKDLRDQQRQADVDKTNVDVVSPLVTAGIVTPDQAKQMLADREVIPQEFVPEDTTPREAISDTEKPEVEAAAEEEASAEPTLEETPPPIENKEIDALRYQFAEAMGQFKQAMAQPAREEPPSWLERLKELVTHREPTATTSPTTIPVTVNITQSPIKVEPPQVTVQPPEVTVKVDKPDPAVITLKQIPPILVPAPVVNVTNQVEPTPVTVENVNNNVVTPTQQTVVEVVKRDAFGRIEEVVRKDENGLQGEPK